MLYLEVWRRERHGGPSGPLGVRVWYMNEIFFHPLLQGLHGLHANDDKGHQVGGIVSAVVGQERIMNGQI